MNSRFENFITLLTRVNRSVQRIKTQEMEDFGLKGVHVMCMAQLSHYPQGLTLSKLAAESMEDKAAVSRAVKELEEKQLVVREGGSGSVGYRSKIILTSLGKEVSAQVEDRINAAVNTATEGISESELDSFRKIFAAIANNLEEA